MDDEAYTRQNTVPNNYLGKSLEVIKKASKWLFSLYRVKEQCQEQRDIEKLRQELEDKLVLYIQIELDYTEKLLITTEARGLKLNRLVKYLSDLMPMTT